MVPYRCVTNWIFIISDNCEVGMGNKKSHINHSSFMTQPLPFLYTDSPWPTIESHNRNNQQTITTIWNHCSTPIKALQNILIVSNRVSPVAQEEEKPGIVYNIQYKHYKTDRQKTSKVHLWTPTSSKKKLDENSLCRQT